MGKKDNKGYIVRARAGRASLEAHRLHVAKLCEELLVRPKHLHGLAKSAAPLLRRMAALHECGPGGAEAGAGRDKAAAERLRILLSDAERGTVMRALALNARGRVPARSRAAERGVEGVSLRLAALFRIAEALDTSRTQRTRVAGVVDDSKAVEILVAGKSSAADASAARVQTRWWNALMLRPVRSVRAAGRGVRAPGLVSRGHSAAEAGRRVLQRQVEQFISRAYGLWNDEDIEYVHEMRVALRALRAARRVFRKAFEDGMPGLSEEVKWLAASLGAVRDQDVFLRFLEGYAAQSPRAERRFLRRLVSCERSRRRRHYAALLRVFRSPRYRRFRDRYYVLLAAPVGSRRGLKARSKRGSRPILREAPRMLLAQLDRVVAHKRKLGGYAPAELHALRIECKRLRYTAQFLADIYPPRLADVVSAMTKMQDALGGLHDCDVYTERVLRYSGRDGGEGRGAKALLAYLAGKRREHLKEASSVWRRFRAAKPLRRTVRIIKSPLRS